MIKKLFIVSGFIFAFVINNLFAQYGIGGKPYSFNHNDTKFAFKSIVLPSFNLEALQAEDAINDLSKGPFRFGFNHFVNINLENSGTWTTLENGDRLWKLGINSPNALSINLAFDVFFMPEGASLFVYNLQQDFVIGAITAINNQEDKAFATDLIPGETAVLEYYEPAKIRGRGKINLFRVTHGYRGVEEYVEKSFGNSGACQVNVNCPLGSSWQDEKNSVVCLVVGGSEFCTGALVDDVPHDGKPYVLTANHCGSSGFSTWVFRFNWEASGCTNPGSSPSTTHSLTGGIQRAASANSDFSLVEINGGLTTGTVPISYNPFFAGWSYSNIPATSAVCIHHPNGDIKKISEATNSCVSASWSGTSANSHWKVGQWTTACTEPGSSGSPLFDQNHKIIGQLHGGPSYCGASAASMNDSYGKFSMSWEGGGTNSTQLKHWLDPASINTDSTNTGHGPYTGISQMIIPTNIIEVFPNPTNGIFSISTNNSTIEKIKIYNVIGELEYVKEFAGVETEITIDLSQKARGVYFVEVTTKNSKSTNKIVLF